MKDTKMYEELLGLNSPGRVPAPGMGEAEGRRKHFACQIGRLMRASKFALAPHIMPSRRKSD